MLKKLRNKKKNFAFQESFNYDVLAQKSFSLALVLQCFSL